MGCALKVCIGSKTAARPEPNLATNRPEPGFGFQHDWIIRTQVQTCKPRPVPNEPNIGNSRWNMRHQFDQYRIGPSNDCSRRILRSESVVTKNSVEKLHMQRAIFAYRWFSAFGMIGMHKSRVFGLSLKPKRGPDPKAAISESGPKRDIRPDFIVRTRIPSGVQVLLGCLVCTPLLCAMKAWCDDHRSSSQRPLTTEPENPTNILLRASQSSANWTWDEDFRWRCELNTMSAFSPTLTRVSQRLIFMFCLALSQWPEIHFEIEGNTVTNNIPQFRKSPETKISALRPMVILLNFSPTHPCFS